MCPIRDLVNVCVCVCVYVGMYVLVCVCTGKYGLWGYKCVPEK